MSTSKLRRSIASLDAFDCKSIEPESRDAAALALALRSTLEQARAGQMSWSDRDALLGWLHKNRKSMPTPCLGLCGRLENRLSFSFLPGLSWPGHRQEAVPSTAVSAAAAAAVAAGAAGHGSAETIVIRRRNLAGLPPPVGKNASEAAEADAAVAAAGSSSAASPSYVSPDSKRGKGTAQEDGNYSSTDDEAGAAGVIGLGGAPRDLVSSGLGSPEILPAVLEQATVDVSSLQEADDNFLLQPTPQGLKTYCIIQRTRSTIRTYFRLFLQEQRPLAEDGGGGDGGDGSASPTTTTTSGPATGVPGGHGGTPPTTSNSTGLDGGSGGGAVSATGGSASGGVTHSGGGMETLKAFLAVGGGGGGGGGSGAGGDGAVGGAQFLLSSKRYRSTKPRSASYVWSRNGVWKDKHALAKVATQPWGGKGKGEGTMTSPSLVGDHLRAATAAAAAAAASAAASPVSPVPFSSVPAPATAFPASADGGGGGGGGGTSVSGSPGDVGSDGSKAQSPALSGSSGGGGGGAAGGSSRGGVSSEGSGCRRPEGVGGSPACWAVVVNVQAEGEGKLLSVAAIVPDPSASLSAPGSASSGGGGGGGGGGEQMVDSGLLAEGLRKWEKTGVVPPGMIVLRSKQPKWSAWQGCHTLDFDRGGERVREPSRKNVSMVAADASPAAAAAAAAGGGGKQGKSAASVAGRGNRAGGGTNGEAQQTEGGDKDHADGHHHRPSITAASKSSLQVGKISEDHFSLDFCWPLSPLQAFVAAMSIFDG